jgi:C-terminal binding protein
MSSHRFQIVVSDFINDSLETEREIVGDIADVIALDAHSESELKGRIEHADAIMLYHNLEIRRPTIDRLERCQLIVRCGVGFDNVDYTYARSRGIAVANVPDYGTEEVADSAIGMMLALTRGSNARNTGSLDVFDGRQAVSSSRPNIWHFGAWSDWERNRTEGQIAGDERYFL